MLHGGFIGMAIYKLDPWELGMGYCLLSCTFLSASKADLHGVGGLLGFQ